MPIHARHVGATIHRAFTLPTPFLTGRWLVAIPETYATVPASLGRLLDAIQTAGVPPRVTFEFLKTLGFKSSNDHTMIQVLKAIGFVDSNGAPTTTYKEYRDPNRGPRVLADALRSAYADLFLANTKANEQSADKLKGIIATKTSKGERVVAEIARTFQALAKKADFAGFGGDLGAGASAEVTSTAPLEPSTQATSATAGRPTTAATFHYNIQIHLPTTTDITVYNAIFRSLREHLL